MAQGTLFNHDVAENIKVTNEAIQRGVDHADLVVEGWSDTAFKLLKEFILTVSTFQSEDFRMWVGDRLPHPPDERAFGAIIRRAVKAGLIKRIGFEPTSDKKTHRSPMSVWEKL